ncbi:MAG: DUF3501 family protein [Myxococcales bacterium]|nr:DUF3501 family protein [Myxococcales bacterium]
MTVTPSDIISNADFLRARPRLEREAMQNATARRARLGAHLTLLFENHATVRWQVQEMCRVENIVGAAAIQHELDTYNALLPTGAADGSAELSATLLIEYTNEVERDLALRALVGLHEHLYIDVETGEGPPGATLTRALARFDGEQFNGERVSAVQFVRFPLSAAMRCAFGDLSRHVSLSCTHSAHPATLELKPALRGALVEDLAATFFSA